MKNREILFSCDEYEVYEVYKNHKFGITYNISMRIVNTKSLYPKVADRT